MQMSGIPFGTTDWSQIQPVEHRGETGLAYWRTRPRSASYRAAALRQAAGGIPNSRLKARLKAASDS